MRTSQDTIRSVKRYVALQLGPEWEVRLASEEGTYQEPYAIVAAVGAALHVNPFAGSGSAEAALNVQVGQPITVYCYPPRSSSKEQGIIDGDRVIDALWDAFVGSVTPYRVPLYDYDGVPLDRPSDVRNEHDYLRLTDVQLNRVPDPADEQRIIVVCDFRVSWLRPTARVAALRAGHVLQSLRQTMVVEGAEQTVHPSGLDAGVVTFGRPRASKV